MDGLEKIEARICCCRLNAALLDAVPLRLDARSATAKINAGIWHLEPHVAHGRYFILCYEKLEFEILKLDSRLVTYPGLKDW
jgi:hypothetical protein